MPIRLIIMIIRRMTMRMKIIILMTKIILITRTTVTI